MRWVHLFIIGLFVLGTIVFAIQNLEAVTMSFLGFTVRAPLAVLTAVIYLLGAVTGGSMFALLRKSIQGAKADRPEAR